MNAPTYPGRDAFTEPRARSTDPRTSHAAGDAVDAAGQRERIMELLKAVGRPTGMWHGGLNADQIDQYIGWRLTTAGRRLSELKRRGLVEVVGERLTRSGRKASVYRAVS